MATIDEMRKIKLLEQSVLYDDVTKLRSVWQENKPFIFTTRALAYACTFGGLEKVKFLLKEGARFSYEETPSLKRLFALTYAENTRTLSSSFNLLPVWNWEHEPCYTEIFWKLHFGNLPKPDLTPLSEQERRDICRYLAAYCPEDFQPGQVLYYAILWQQWEIAESLMDSGVLLRENIPNKWGWPSEYRQCTDEYIALTHLDPTAARKELCGMLLGMREENHLRALTLFHTALTRIHPEKKLIFSFSDLAEPGTGLISPSVIRFLVDYTETENWPKKKVLELLVDASEPESLRELLDRGWLKTAASRDKLIEYANQTQKTEALAVLLDYKNRTADPQKEAEAQRKKQQREMNAAGNPLTELKKLWSFRRLEDGTLEITSYKGRELHICVPEEIGGKPVRVIGQEAFSPWVRGSAEQKEHRKNIQSVILPKGLLRIEPSAFFECENLASVAIPDSINFIGDRAFSGCKSLTSIVIPNGITSIEKFSFCDCKGLTSITIPQGVTNIDSFAFSGCQNLTDVVVPESVTAIGFRAFPDSFGLFLPSKLVIHAPAGSYAETYAKENSIPFIAE